MAYQKLDLDSDPKAALEAVRARSREHPVLVFKRSPICPVSHRAEAQFDRWLGQLAESAELWVASIDVIGEKPLARGLTSELGIAHESPQALFFDGGELVWHDSHGALTVDRFDAVLAGKP